MTQSSQTINKRRCKSQVLKRQEEIRHHSRQILIVTGVLLVLGILALFSASTAPLAARGDFPYSTVLKQIMFIGISLLAAGFIGAVVLPKLSERALKFLVQASFAFSILMLLAVLFTPLGQEVNGALRWLRIGPIQFQPAEFLKITLVLFIASLLLAAGKSKMFASFRTERGELMTIRRDRLQLIWVLLAVILCLVLVVAQPDLGTTAIVFAASVVTMFLVGVPGRGFVTFAVLLVVLLGAGYLYKPEKYAYGFERIYTAFHPMEDPSDEGYQIVQSMGAVSSGGLLGRGYMKSEQKMNRLPFQDRDFIFAIWVEETGLLGGVLVVGLFLYLAFLCLRISVLLPFCFESVAVFALGFNLSLQAIINVATNVGALPVSGLTLPFFSSGGTSMLVSLLIIGTILGLIRRKLPAPSGA